MPYSCTFGLTPPFIPRPKSGKFRIPRATPSHKGRSLHNISVKTDLTCSWPKPTLAGHVTPSQPPQVKSHINCRSLVHVLIHRPDSSTMQFLAISSHTKVFNEHGVFPELINKMSKCNTVIPNTRFYHTDFFSF